MKAQAPAAKEEYEPMGVQPVYYRYISRSKAGQFLSDWFYVFKWLIRASLLRPIHPPETLPPPMKRAVLRRLARRHKLGVFVETGTWLGDTIESLSAVCGTAFSIELQPHLYAKAKERFRDRRTIKILQGSGPNTLPYVLSQLKEPALFWLDGHFASDTPGLETCPTLEELTLILKHPVTGHVICIDDMREFKGVGGYPTIEELTKTVFHVRPEARVTVKNDIMRISTAAL